MHSVTVSVPVNFRRQHLPCQWYIYMLRLRLILNYGSDAASLKDNGASFARRMLSICIRTVRDADKTPAELARPRLREQSVL